eukprot:4838439-Pyramimonas_sp.AAC.1
MTKLGGLSIKAVLTIDAESVFRSSTSKDLKKPTACAPLGHISWVRRMMDRGLAHGVHWCDARDMTADGHANTWIDRALLLQAMRGNRPF